MTHPGPTPHDHHDRRTHADGTTCEHCIMPSPTNRSEKIAWTVAGIAVAILLAVFFMGAGSTGGTLLAGGSGLVLLALLACPLMMGAMMWMMREQH